MSPAAPPVTTLLPHAESLSSAGSSRSGGYGMEQSLPSRPRVRDHHLIVHFAPQLTPYVRTPCPQATLMKRTLDPEEEAGTMQEVDIPVKDPDDSVRKPPSVKSDKAQSVHSAGSGRETGTETGTEGEEVDDGMVEVEEKHVRAYGGMYRMRVACGALCCFRNLCWLFPQQRLAQTNHHLPTSAVLLPRC